MDVVLQRLAPRMQDGGHANLAAQVLLRKGLQRLVGRAEQKIVDRLRVDRGQRIDPVIEREDHVKVRHRQQARGLLRQPLRLLPGPAFRAVAVVTRVEDQLHAAAGVAHPQMATQRRGATLQDGIHRGELLSRTTARFSGGPVAPDRSQRVARPVRWNRVLGSALAQHRANETRCPCRRTTPPHQSWFPLFLFRMVRCFFRNEFRVCSV
jgi:hypothetical protein